MKLKHAKHNEEACDLLLKDGKFCDWVVTTAFYSALHYVQNEVFPLVEHDKTYPSFNNYYHSILKPKDYTTNKHRATIELVDQHIPEGLIYYRWLYDACMNARYFDYQVSELKAKTARKNLTALKKLLKKK